VVLVLGAGGRAAQAAALRLSAHGAAIVAAGPALADVVTTAGLVAATGAVARVVEPPAPPLLGHDLLRAAAAAFEPVTDAVVCPEAFPSPLEAADAARALGASLPEGGRVLVLDPDRGAGAEAERAARSFLGDEETEPERAGDAADA
jgi:hypothetical protein